MAQGGNDVHIPPAPPDMLAPSFRIEEYIHPPSIFYKLEDCLNKFPPQFEGSLANETNSPVRYSAGTTLYY